MSEFDTTVKTWFCSNCRQWVLAGGHNCVLFSFQPFQPPLLAELNTLAELNKLAESITEAISMIDAIQKKIDVILEKVK